METEQLSKQIIDELNKRKSNGEFVPEESFVMANDLDELAGCQEMNLSDCVDYIISMSQL